MNPRSAELSRRGLVCGALAWSGFLAAGCSPADKKAASDADRPGQSPTASPQAAAMTVYRDPSCGCCEVWAERAREAGYQVALIDDPNMPAVKQRHGVPEALSSCHTAIVGGYAIEGHVPLAHVKRLLAERPAGIRGIAVPGMPRGSPGMEMPDGSKDPFKVMAFDAAGKTSDFRA